MKTTFVLALAVLGCFAANVNADTKPFAEPILLTSCGQSADALMMKTLLTRDSLAFAYLPTATAADLAGRGSVLIVVGGSSKGLGAAKISAEDEKARVEALLKGANEAGIPVMAVHMGGATRRGALSDEFNRLGAEYAQKIIVVRGGNEDGLFTRISEEKKVPLQTAETALQVSPLLKAAYRQQ